MADEAILTHEAAFYARHKADYLRRFPGLFVLVKGDRMLGPFPTAEAAYEQGLREIGLEPVLIQQVLEEEPVGFVPILFGARKADARP